MSDSDLLDCSSVTNKWDCTEKCVAGGQRLCGYCGSTDGGPIGKKIGKGAKKWEDGGCRGEDEYSSDFTNPVVICPKLVLCGVQDAATKSLLKNYLESEKERRKGIKNLIDNCNNPVDITGVGTWLCCDSPENKKLLSCRLN